MTLTRLVGITLAALTPVFVGAGAHPLGVHNTERANWHAVTVDLSDVAADEKGPHRLLSMNFDGWTYAIEDSVKWIDPRGTQYGEGWPERLEPRHPGIADKNREKVRFRFAEVSANADGFGWRPVVMVDCRTTHA